MRLDLIVCVDKNGGIGKSGTIPWKITEDIVHFRTITSTVSKTGKKNAVIMGRKTWNSIPEQYRPLKDRYNVVITSDGTGISSEATASSFNEAVNIVDMVPNIESVFVIGGLMVYTAALNDPRVRYLYKTVLSERFDCDIFLPDPENGMKLVEQSDIKQFGNVRYRFKKYVKPNYDEMAFQLMLKNILAVGEEREDRTGVGTFSLFGKHLEFNLETGFPLMTSRRCYLRPVLEEFKWMMSGSTDSTVLSKKDVHVWEKNTSRDVLNEKALWHYDVGEIGPTYGFALRYFGGHYHYSDPKLKDCGHDQLEYVIDEIRKNPTSRRIRISLWDPNVLSKVALPPCLCQYDFHVNIKKGTLDLCAFLRSSDSFLAFMWNTSFCAIFVHVLCKFTGYKPGRLIMNTGDSHVYKNHVEQVEEQISRDPYPFPSVFLTRKLTEISDIADLEVGDFNLRGYDFHPTIKGEMAV
jgi:dihydrofolate reductase / thymidylate synthase